MQQRGRRRMAGEQGADARTQLFAGLPERAMTVLRRQRQLRPQPALHPEGRLIVVRAVRLRRGTDEIVPSPAVGVAGVPMHCGERAAEAHAAFIAAARHLQVFENQVGLAVSDAMANRLGDAHSGGGERAQAVRFSGERVEERRVIGLGEMQLDYKNANSAVQPVLVQMSPQGVQCEKS